MHFFLYISAMRQFLNCFFSSFSSMYFNTRTPFDTSAYCTDGLNKITIIIIIIIMVVIIIIVIIIIIIIIIIIRC